MPELLEDELTRIFADAGSTLDTPPDLAFRAEARYRGRRSRRTVLGAVTIIAVLTAIATTLPHLNRGPATTAAPTARSSAGPSASGPPPRPEIYAPSSTAGLQSPEKVWPGRIGFVPKRAPGGGAYVVEAALDPDTVAVSWFPDREHATKLFAYNVRTGHATLLTDLRGPAGVKEYSLERFETNESKIFWWAYGTSAGHLMIYVWSVDRTGGTPQLLTSFQGTDDHGQAIYIDQVAADETDVYWNAPGRIQRVAVTGGLVEDVPGTEGYVLRGFPWTMNYSRHTLRNVLTGEQTQVHAGDNVPFCRRDFCYGRNKDHTGYLIRPDGTGRVDVGHFEYSYDQIIDNHIALAFVSDKNLMALVDVTGGKAAIFQADGVSPMLGGTICWDIGNGVQVFLPAR